MNETDILNNLSEATDGKIDYVLNPLAKITDWISSQIASLGIQYSSTMSRILTIFLALLFIFIATKISNKIIKYILYILAIILIIGTVYLIIQNFT